MNYGRNLQKKDYKIYRLRKGKLNMMIKLKAINEQRYEIYESK